VFSVPAALQWRTHIYPEKRWLWWQCSAWHGRRWPAADGDTPPGELQAHRCWSTSPARTAECSWWRVDDSGPPDYSECVRTGTNTERSGRRPSHLSRQSRHRQLIHNTVYNISSDKTSLLLGQCQTHNKVEQFCPSTLLRNKVARLTSQVAQLLTSHATKLLDRNRLYSSAICCSVAELWLVNWLFIHVKFVNIVDFVAMC